MPKVVKGSFVAIVAKDARPLFKDLRLSEEIRNTEIPVVLMINRVDGKIGFPGGTMEEGETPIQTALREVGEEIGILWEQDDAELEYVGQTTYEDDRIDLSTHLFVQFVDYSDLTSICDEIRLCDHFGSEINGFVELGIFNHRKGGYSEFLKNNFPHTAKEQLEMLVEKYGLLVDLVSPV
jgi:U8 snoRNA-decapping enzyme